MIRMNPFWLSWWQASMAATQAAMQSQQLLLRQAMQLMGQGGRQARRLPEAAKAGERLTQAALAATQGVAAQRVEQGGRRGAKNGRRRGRRPSQALAANKPRRAQKRGRSAKRTRFSGGRVRGRRKAG